MKNIEQSVQELHFVQYVCRDLACVPKLCLDIHNFGSDHGYKNKHERIGRPRQRIAFQLFKKKKNLKQIIIKKADDYLLYEQHKVNKALIFETVLQDANEQG